MSLWIIYTDVFYRLIQNIQVVVVVLLASASVFCYELELNLWGSFWVLIVGIVLWSFRIVGAGDIKLLATLSLCMPDNSMFYFLFLMSIIGSVLAFFIWTYSMLRNKRISVPYGVAICVSFLLVFIPEVLSRVH